jgi:hypothetical protein
MPELHDVGKIGRFLKTSVAVLDGAELLFTIVSETSTGTIIPPQAPLPSICPGT